MNATVKRFTWNELAQLCNQLAAKLRALPEDYDIIVGIARGGLFPALMLSNLLNVRDVQLISVRTTENDSVRSTRTPPQVTALPNNDSVAHRRCLLVDDVTNTGETLRLAVETLQGLGAASITTAAIAWDTVGPNGFGHVDACAAQVVATTAHAWIEVPWQV